MAKSYKYSRSRKKLTLDKCLLRLTDAIKEMERIILDGNDDNTKIQAANCMTGLVSRYSKIIEVSDLEERLNELEKKQENKKMRAVK